MKIAKRIQRVCAVFLCAVTLVSFLPTAFAADKAKLYTVIEVDAGMVVNGCSSYCVGAENWDSLICSYIEEDNGSTLLITASGYEDVIRVVRVTAGGKAARRQKARSIPSPM